MRVICFACSITGKDWTHWRGPEQTGVSREKGLPDEWDPRVEKKDNLDLKTPFNFVCTADIIGGNSGSPVINRDAEVVGLIFDGNIRSLGAGFGYDGDVSRAIAVNVGALRAALAKVYRADRVVDELRQ